MSVIDSVSKTIVDLLNPALDPLLPAANEPFAQISDLQKPVSLTPATVTVFLFDVFEDPSARNRPRQRVELPGNLRIRKPDMALQLRYLLTPWSQKAETEQAMLGTILQTLYDNAILRGTQLSGDLRGTALALKITQSQLSIEDRTRVWHSLHKPYKLSVIYDVRVVPLPTLVDEPVTQIHQRSLRYGETPLETVS